MFTNSRSFAIALQEKSYRTVFPLVKLSGKLLVLHFSKNLLTMTKISNTESHSRTY